MQMNNDRRIAKLNDVLELIQDGIKGYNTCIETEKNTQYLDMFQRYLAQRHEYATELSHHITSIGGTPSEGGDATGSLHRTWIDIKTALSGNPTLALIEEAKRGDASACESLTKLLLDENLTIEDRAMIGKYLAGMALAVTELKAHEVVENVKDEIK
jgi:uncharacterized protein (TIGR02284 family)